MTDQRVLEVALLGQVVTKVLNQGCLRVITPGWPNMSWSWDLVDLSVSNFTFPVQVGEPSNLTVQQVPTHEPSEIEYTCLVPRATAIQKQVFLTKWLQELRLLKDFQAEVSVSRSGPFFCQMVRVRSGGLHVTLYKTDLSCIFFRRKISNPVSKGRRCIPSLNLSLVLHHLTKPPFEPLRKKLHLRI